MNSPLENARLTLAVAIGVGMLVAGVGNLLVGARRWRGQLPFALAGVGAGAGTTWVFDDGLAAWVGGAGVGLLVLLTVLQAVNVSAATSRVAVAFRSARARWAAVAAVGLAGLGYELVRFDRAERTALDAEMAEMIELTDAVGVAPVSGVRLLTDRGTAITPLTGVGRRSAEQFRRIEARTLAGLPAGDQVIHRGKPSDTANCHGWVFTGGKYAIGGTQVDAILTDNGYAVVSQPAAGDVCIYRTGDGAVSHTALVRAVCDDGTVLVEGKWGWLGVYLHPVQSSCYGTRYQFYRTGRTSHRLADLPVESGPATPAAQPAP